MKRFSALLFAVAVLLTGLAVPCTSIASDKGDAQAIVTKANITFNSFMSDKNFTEMRKLSRSAKGIFIAPQVLKGAFVVGASGGTGVFLVREEGGKWTNPAFYTMGSVSFGFQIGGQASEVILLAMTDRGVTTMLQSSVKLGADVVNHSDRGLMLAPVDLFQDYAPPNAADYRAPGIVRELTPSKELSSSSKTQRRAPAATLPMQTSRLCSIKSSSR